SPAVVSRPPPAAPPTERTVMVQIPQELLAASAVAAPPPPPARPAAPPPPAPSAAAQGAVSLPPAQPRHIPGGAPPSEATVMMAVPQELLAKTSAPSAADEEEAHFRDVFQQFIKTRDQCGEPADDLTYDRFVGKLHKNKQQLVEKYGCKTVRFQVYVKAGKAALKAVPVRD
ncbi:MAG: MXAN_5187 C-terminal domain-containing protein, partial [Myxococcota bacterium]